MRVQARTNSFGLPPSPVEARSSVEEPDTLGDSVRWLEAKTAGAAELPLLRPIVGRDLHRRVFQEIIKKRAVPLLRRLAVAQAELRSESADRAREKSRALLERVREFDLGILDSSDTFFDQVQSISRDIDGILEDASYAVFDQVPLLQQLRALNVGLHSSRSLWQTIRVGYAMRDPALQTDAIQIGTDAKSVFDRGWRGEDISRDLEQLEGRFGDFKLELDGSIGGDSGLGIGLDSLRVSRRAWAYRTLLERAILVRERREGHLGNGELCGWVHANGVPPEVVNQILEQDVLPSLRSIAEDPERAEHAAEAQARVQKLLARIDAMDPEQLRTADQIEAFALDIGRALDAILADLEKVAQPADGMVRKLRETRAVSDSIRMMLLGLRVVETAQDTTYQRSATDLFGELGALTESDPRPFEQRLAALESHLSALGDDTKARLHIDSVPALDKGLGLLRNTRKMVRLRDAVERAMNPEIRLAADAFSDLEMSSARRREIYDRALGEPLLETSVGVLLATRELDLGFSFKDMGRRLGRLLHAGGDGDVNPLIAKTPLAFLARADFENAFSRFDEFLDNAHTPERRSAIDGTLNVVRALASVEREALGEVAARIPEGQGMALSAATIEWLVSSMEVLLEWTAKELATPSGVATADFLDLMVDATEAHLDALMGKDPRSVAGADLAAFRTDLGASAGEGAKQVGARRAPDFVQAMGARKPEGRHAERLRAINERLLDRMKSVETTESSRKAMKHILGDMGATLRTVVNLIHLFGAVSNDQMDADERGQAIQGSIERMGPLFVKLMQTLANMQELLGKLSPDFAIKPDDPLFTSLKRLQDEVSPLPWSYIEEQIRTSLEIGPDAPLVEADGWPAPFVSMEQEPLKSGSIGQTHRAKIRVDRGDHQEIVDVVVKVLRPDIDKTFEDTIRVTRLTILVFKELLRLDANASIFGSVKGEAERVLSMLERALEGFIETFRIETNFVQEAENLRRFRSMHATDRNVVVPEVFDSHCKGTILTMEEIKGFKLSKWLERHRFAEAAPQLAEQMGPLPKQGTIDELLKRSRLFVEQTYAGTPVEARVVSQTPRDATVRVRFLDPQSRMVDQTLEARLGDGRISGGVGAPVTRLGAERKASIWATKTFGLPVKSASGHYAEDKGYLVTVDLDSPRAERALAFVDRSTGALEARSEVPDLTKHGLEGLRDRLTTTYGIQLVRGLLHGDPHDANFFILPDGKSVGLLDFGLALEIGMFDAVGPFNLLSGAFLGKPRRMADAMLRMSTQGELPEPEREALAQHLSDEFAQIIGDVGREAKAKSDELANKPWWLRLKSKIFGRFDQAQQVTKRSLELVLRNEGLAPTPRYLQALKATFSMGGNLATLEKEGLEKTPKWKRALRLFKDITIQTCLRPFMRWKERRQKLTAPPPTALPLWMRMTDPRLERLEHVKQSGAPGS